MPQLVYRLTARQDIAAIAARIEQESRGRAVADAFIEKITNYCEHLATLPTMMGRARPELRPQYRSVTFGNYVIFLRYGHEDGLRSHLYIIHILYGSRDLDAYFRDAPDPDMEA